MSTGNTIAQCRRRSLKPRLLALRCRCDIGRMNKSAPLSTHVDHAETLLPMREVEARTGCSRSFIYARIRAGAFPKPIKLSAKIARWKSSAVSAWIEGQSA